jgi:acyl carrier protein
MWELPLNFDDKKLKQTIATILQLDVKNVREDSSVDTLENWDSVNHLNLILALEEEFNVTLPEDEIANLSSYQLIKMVLIEQLKAQ